MRFVSFQNDKTGARRFMTTDSLLLGGIETKEGQVSLFAPKIPPLHIPCADPAMLATTLMNFMAGGATEGITNMGALQVLNLNQVVTA